MNLQDRYRTLYKQLNPSWNDSQSIYKHTIKSLLTPDSRILDVGCGHTTYLADILTITPHTYGLEPDARALEKNTSIKHKHTGLIDAAPFADNTFDVVTLLWVLEHLDDPRRAFTEIHRILKPGGHVMFLTPNTRNYVVWINRLIPNRFHEFFTKRLYQREEHDTYPTRYRVNSPKAVERILSTCGLQQQAMIVNGDPTYIGLNGPLFKLACLIERLLAIPALQTSRVHLVGHYRKPAISH